MDWWRILKEAKSPKAVEHKRRYETEYESSPSRKKYRRDLERERRKRGVAGKGGKDMSHTKTGKIVPEDPHTNRARSHPSVGSTLKTFLRPCNYCGVITRPGQQCKCGNMVKAPLYDTATGEQVAGVPTKKPDNLEDPRFEYDYSNHGPVKPNERFLYQSPDQKVRAIVESKGRHATIPLFATHNDARYKGRGRQALRDIRSELRSIHPNVEHIEPTGVTPEALGFWDKMHDEGLVGDERTMKRSEPMEIAMRLLKEQKKLFGGQQTLDGQFTFDDPTDFAGQEQQRQAALKEQRVKQNRMLERMRHESITNKERNAEFRANQARAKQIREAQRRKNAEGLTPLPHFQQNPE